MQGQPGGNVDIWGFSTFIMQVIIFSVPWWKIFMKVSFPLGFGPRIIAFWNMRAVKNRIKYGLLAKHINLVFFFSPLFSPTLPLFLDCTDNQVKYLKVFPAEKPVQCPDEHLECIKLCEFENYLDSFDYKESLWLSYKTLYINYKMFSKLVNKGDWNRGADRTEYGARVVLIPSTKLCSWVNWWLSLNLSLLYYEVL